MKKLLVLTISFLFLWVSSGLAEPIIQKKHTWELGTEIFHFKYEEPNLMENKGMMYGLVGSYTYHGGIMFNGEGRFSYGQVDYTSSGTGSMDNIDDYIFEIRGVVGYDFPLSETFFLTPYIGLGYRYLFDDKGGRTSTTGQWGYDRESNYYYSPIGLWMNTNYEKWSFGLILEYDIFWWGKQTSYYSDVPGYSFDVENDQDEGYGLRSSFKIVRKFTRTSLVIEPFVRYWDIDDSDISLGFIEPANETIEAGIKIAIRF